MMKVSWFWLMFLLVGTAFMFLAFSSSSNSFPGMAFPDHRVVTAIATNRKLKAKRNLSSFEKKRREADNINLEDYHVVDPVPSSKAAIKAGPIAHGTPLIPYIPKPEPPSHP